MNGMNGHTHDLVGSVHLKSFKSKLVRDLIWVVGSPNLLQQKLHIDPNDDGNSVQIDCVPDAWALGTVQQAQDWLRSIDEQPQHLEQYYRDHSNTRALGGHFACLYEYWLRFCPAVPSSDLVTGRQVKAEDGKQTVGALEFVFKLPTASAPAASTPIGAETCCHWEVSVKFFLYSRERSEGEPSLVDFTGPFMKETLQMRAKKLVSQLKLLQNHGVRSWLDEQYPAVRTNFIQKGYLFYPYELWRSGEKTVMPSLAPSHLHGWWTADPKPVLNAEVNNAGAAPLRWLVLPKLHWLSPAVAEHSPDTDGPSVIAADDADRLKLITTEQLLEVLVAHFAQPELVDRIPLLVARMHANDGGSIWTEHSRGFVVDKSWGPIGHCEAKPKPIAPTPKEVVVRSVAPVGSCHTPTTPTTPLSPAIVAPPTTLLEMIRRGQGEALMQVAPHTVMHWSSAVPDELSAIDGVDAPKWSEKTLDEVLSCLVSHAMSINADVTVLRRAQQSKSSPSSGSWIADCLVRLRRTDAAAIPALEDGGGARANQDYVEVRVAVVGNVDSGKSTLVGVLAMGGGTLDNGRGLMRGTVFRHRHERVSGRTSSISERVMGFNSKGQRIDTSAAHSRDKKKSSGPDKTEPLTDKPKENYGLKEVQAATQMVVESCSKIVTLVDLAGHAKYLKTTVLGLTGRVSDYCCVVVGANMGVLKMTKEHIGCALALRVPSFFVLTKTDICPPNVLQETLDNLVKLLKSQGVRKLPYIIRSLEDVLVCVRQLGTPAAIKLAPIFVTSNVTGDGMDLLFHFMNLLPAAPAEAVPDVPNAPSADCEFRVDEVFFVPRVGPVVSGVLTRGVVHLNTQLMLGPDGSGKFHQVQVRGIHRHRVATDSVRAKRAVTFALKGAPMGTGKRPAIRRGMVLTSGVCAPDRPMSCRRFEAEVVILHHPTTIEVNYQPVVHCAGVRQAVRVLAIRKGGTPTIDDDVEYDHEAIVLRTGDSARVDFEFMLRPECIAVHSRLLFLEGRTKGVGKVTQVYPIS